MRICSIEGCGRKHYALGYCNTHWKHYKTGKIIKRLLNDPNEIIVEDQICRMKLYNRKGEEIAETIFDLKYKSEIEKYKWCLNDGYVGHGYIDEKGKNKDFKLHQLIMYLSEKELKNNDDIDHKDTNKLNNLENNLRSANKFQNNQNTAKKIKGLSKYKGVSFHDQMNKWRAVITVNYKQIRLGFFKEEKDAALAYNNAALQYHGEFANLNEGLNE